MRRSSVVEQFLYLRIYIRGSVAGCDRTATVMERAVSLRSARAER